MKVSLKNIIVPQIPLAVLLVISCMALWFVTYLGGHNTITNQQNNTLVSLLQSIIIPHSVLSEALCIAITMLNAYLLAQINNRFTIIRTRTFLPIFIFLILISSWDETHEINGSHFILTFTILSIFYFLNTYRDRNSSEMAFMGSFLIGLTSLVNNPLILLIPVSWIGFIILQSISLRTILASIFGAVTPWTLYLATMFYLNPETEILPVFNNNFTLEINILSISLYQQIYIALLLIILVINIFGMYTIRSGDVIRTRNNLNYLLLLLCSVLLIALFFQNELITLMPIIAMCYALIVSYAFTLKINNFNGILFIIFCIINIAFVLSKFFTLQ